MKTIAAVDAKRSFGELLDTARREPVAIAKRGRTVAVLMSQEEFVRMDEAYQQARTDEMIDEICADPIKLERLKARLRPALNSLDQGRGMDGDAALDRLEAKYQAMSGNTPSE